MFSIKHVAKITFIFDIASIFDNKILVCHIFFYFDMIKERLFKVAETEGLSVRKLEEACGLGRGNISNMSTEGSIGSDKLSKIIDTFPHLNVEWILTGRGEMYKEPSPKMNVKRINTSKSYEPTRETQSIPLYDFVATAGLKEFTDNSSQYASNYIQIPYIPACDGAMRIMGDSMEPILKSGEIVAFKMLPPVFDSIIYGRIYIVSYIVGGDAHVVVKRIDKSEEGEPYIKLVSENPVHKPLDINFQRVNAIASVKASINISSME